MESALTVGGAVEVVFRPNGVSEEVFQLVLEVFVSLKFLVNVEPSQDVHIELDLEEGHHLPNTERNHGVSDGSLFALMFVHFKTSFQTLAFRTVPPNDVVRLLRQTNYFSHVGVRTKRKNGGV